MTTTTRLAAIYARVSTEEQMRGEIPSTTTQVDKCREKADANAIPVASAESGLIVEEQHSGSDLRWEGTKFMELVRRAERGEFTDLICLDIDRFCRGGSDAYGEQKGHFTNAGVTIHYVMVDFSGTPFRGGMEALLADASQWWKDKIREASMRKRTAIAKAGNITPGHTPPFGFQWKVDTGRLSKRGKPMKVGLEPAPVTAPALLHMTQHIADGGSVYALKLWLEANHILTPRGSAQWHETTIRRILHNETNYGGRKSFVTKVVPRPEGVRRPASLKTRSTNVRRDPSEQYPVKAEYVAPIPGLTYALWKRALDQLAQNKAFAARNAKAPLEERVQRGLLLSGMAQCAVCRRSLNLHSYPDGNGGEGAWMYRCGHYDTPFFGSLSVNIVANKLDALVWRVAVGAMRDPAFFDRLLADTDAAGLAARVASLERQLSVTTAAGDTLMRQLARLDPDDDLVPEYQEKLRQNKTSREELATALAAAERAAAAEDTRRATVEAFRAYAAEQGTTVEDKTPLERHRILRALHTHVGVDRGEALDRVRILFDIRQLRSAQAVFTELRSSDDGGTPRPNGPFSWYDIPVVTIVDDDE